MGIRLRMVTKEMLILCHIRWVVVTGLPAVKLNIYIIDFRYPERESLRLYKFRSLKGKGLGTPSFMVS